MEGNIRSLVMKAWQNRWSAAKFSVQCRKLLDVPSSSYLAGELGIMCFITKIVYSFLVKTLTLKIWWKNVVTFPSCHTSWILCMNCTIFEPHHYDCHLSLILKSCYLMRRWSVQQNRNVGRSPFHLVICRLNELNDRYFSFLRATSQWGVGRHSS